MKQHKVDAKGLQCPQPIVETSRVVKAAASGDLIIVEATDKGFYSDIKVWCERNNAEVIKYEDRMSFYRVEIKKK